MISGSFVGAIGDGVTGAGIYKLDSGHLDGGQPVYAQAETNAIAPGGAGADHVFDWLRITVTGTMATQLVVTPLLDGKPITGAEFTIALTASADPTSTVFERMIRAETGGRTYAPRGTWLSVRFRVPAVAAGSLTLDGVEVEYEVLTPTKVRI
jgi:hypothetical protein